MAEERVVTFDEFVKLAEGVIQSKEAEAGFSFIQYDDSDDNSPYHYRLGKMNWFDSSMLFIGGYGGYTTAFDIMDFEEGYEDLRKRIGEFFAGYLFWKDKHFKSSKIKVEFD